MIDKNRHTALLVNILKDIYSEPKLRTKLGFKGGTAVYLFYDLPRMSVDLDFDLLTSGDDKIIFQTINKILSNYGKIKDTREKRFTIFFLLSYEVAHLNIKVEISKRQSVNQYEKKSYLGVPVLVATKETLVSSKLAAFLSRKRLASRDVYDLWYMLKLGWDLDEDIVNHYLQLNLEQAIQKAITKIDSIKQSQLLQGVGELLDSSNKNWVRGKLKEELLFQLKLRQKILK